MRQDMYDLVRRVGSETSVHVCRCIGSISWLVRMIHDLLSDYRLIPEVHDHAVDRLEWVTHFWCPPNLSCVRIHSLVF
jgi:hypothetical protein